MGTPEEEELTRVLGIDFGEKRVGVSLSDPSGKLASPLTTLRRRRGQRPPLRDLEELVRTHGVREVIVGLPLPLDGEEDGWCAEVRDFGRALGERIGRPVQYVDERFSSKSAERAVRSSGLRKAQREEKDRIDAAAAAVILQSYLDGAPLR